MRALGDIRSRLAVDERYVYFNRRGTAGLRIYDSLRRRIRVGRTDCKPDVAAHGVLLAVCGPGYRPVLYRVRDGRTIPIEHLEPGYEVLDVGRYWLLAGSEGGMGADYSFIQWHTGETIDDRRSWAVDLDSRQPKRDPEEALLEHIGVVAVELPYVLRARSRLVLTRRHHPSLVLDRHFHGSNGELVARRAYWLSLGLKRANGYDIRRRRSVSWHLRRGTRGVTLGLVPTRYQFLLVAREVGRSRLYATSWPPR